MPQNVALPEVAVPVAQQVIGWHVLSSSQKS
jgi:hypothetical protein